MKRRSARERDVVALAQKIDEKETGNGYVGDFRHAACHAVVLVLIGDQTLLRDVDVDGHAVDELYGIELEFQYAVDAAAVRRRRTEHLAGSLSPHRDGHAISDLDVVHDRKSERVAGLIARRRNRVLQCDPHERAGGQQRVARLIGDRRVCVRYRAGNGGNGKRRQSGEDEGDGM